MWNGYRSHTIERGLVDACLARVLVETSRGEVRIGDVVQRLQAARVRVFFVGGAPRDWLCGASVKDVDFAVDCSIQRCHALLLAAYPDPDALLIENETFGMLRWGSPQCGNIDINILRSPDAFVGRPLSQTRFIPSGSLYEDSLTRDFSINVFYYDCASACLLEPCEGSLEDLRARRLRLVSDPRKLAVDFRTSLRIAQFICRGYEPVATTWEHLERYADRDVQGMGTMLAGWVSEHLPEEPHVRARFQSALAPHLRQLASRELLQQSLEPDAPGDRVWSPSGPGGG